MKLESHTLTVLVPRIHTTQLTSRHSAAPPRRIEAVAARCEMPDRATWIWGAVIVALGFGLRAGFVLGTRGYRALYDAGDYVRLAVSLAHGHGVGTSAFTAGPTAFRPPLYPGFLAALFAIAGYHLTVARLAQAALGALAVALFGVIGWQLWGRRGALAAMVLAALLPSFIFTGTALLSEALFVPLLAAALAAGLRSRTSSHPVRWAVLAGALAGLCALTRPNGILVPLCVAALVPITIARASWRGWKAPAAVLVAAVVVVAPWTIRNAVTFHAFIPVTDADGFNLAGTYNAETAVVPGQLHGDWIPPQRLPQFRGEFTGQLNEYQIDSRLRAAGITYMSDHPGYVLTQVGVTTARLLGANMTWARYSAEGDDYGIEVARFWLVGWLALAAVGLAGVASRAARRLPVALWIAPVLFWITTINGDAEYRIPIEAFVLLFATAALVAVWDRFAPADLMGRT